MDPRREREEREREERERERERGEGERERETLAGNCLKIARANAAYVVAVTARLCCCCR